MEPRSYEPVVCAAFIAAQGISPIRSCSDVAFMRALCPSGMEETDNNGRFLQGVDGQTLQLQVRTVKT